MVFFPPCKINLGIHVVSKRNDGFHNIETCFYPVPWTDVLEIIPGNESLFSFSGTPVPGSPEKNLCVRAFSLLKKDFDVPPAQLHLHKIIPSGAGLGGGSSDAAFTLKALNEIFSLGLTKDRLGRYALELGSDCPFFIEPKPCIGTGKGEILNAVNLSLTGKFIVIISPALAVSTAEAYREVTPRKPKVPLAEILARPLPDWRGNLVNDFESSVFERHPTLGRIKEQLYELGAAYASMSGSGSSIFGLFNRTVEMESFEGMKVFTGIFE